MTRLAGWTDDAFHLEHRFETELPGGRGRMVNAVAYPKLRVKWATDGAGPRTMPELLETMGFAAAACKATNVPDCLVHFDAGYTAISVALRAEAGL